MAKRPTILLLIPHLRGGGAARVMTLLAQSLSPVKYNLHLALVAQTRAPHLTLPQWVHIHSLNAHRVRASGLPVLRLIHSLKPDVVFSCMAHLNFLVLLIHPFFPGNTRILIRQNGMALHSARKLPSSLIRSFYRLLYPRADRIICQTNAMAAELAHLTAHQGKITVLPNPVDIDAVRMTAGNSASHYIGAGPHVLAVGRLSREKGFDLLLRAFAEVRRRFPPADLTIVGSGPDETSLKALRQSLQLTSAVRFTGNIPRPEVWFAGCSLFVLSSRHEGMPNALLEAAAGGLPIVALPAHGGVPDLLQDHDGIWLAQEISAKALAKSICSALQTLKPAERFAHSWINDFRIDRSIALFEALIDETLPGRPA